MKYIVKNVADEVQPIADLINSAYRGIEGAKRWTTENHLVDGDRITPDDLIGLILDDKTDFIIGCDQDRLVSCISIKHSSGVAEFGTFAVDPNLQGSGYGIDLFKYAENYAMKYAKIFQVAVVSQNKTLINFYVRRGYNETGQKIPYPTNQNVGKPKFQDIDLTVLQKSV